MPYMETIEKEKPARLNCRIKAPIKKQAEDAAQLLGLSITDFTESALAEKAQAVFSQHERIALSEREFARFIELIENPQPPTHELSAAMHEFEQKIATGRIIDNT